MDRVFFISDKGELIGTKAKRVPRKKKKFLKKSGLYEGNPIQGILISKTLIHQGHMPELIPSTTKILQGNYRIHLWPKN